MNYNLKLCILILSVFINSNILSSQSIEKAFEKYEEKDYKLSIEYFKKVISKKKNIIEAKYGLALIYSNIEFKRYKNSKAYGYE